MSTPHPAERSARSYAAGVAGAAFLAAQVGFVVYAHAIQPPSVAAALDGCAAYPTSCTRYFAWAPNDYLVEYRLSVETGGETLTEDESLRRYGLHSAMSEFPVEHLMNKIRVFEETSARDDGATEVVLEYSINGRPPQVWRWHD